MDNKKDLSNYIFIGIIIMSLIFFSSVIMFNRNKKKPTKSNIKSLNQSQSLNQSENHSQDSQNQSQDSAQLFRKSLESRINNKFKNMNKNDNDINSFTEVISSQNIPSIITNDIISSM